ncbi:hypothetical protein GCM10010275_64310 [Streptomyces litmocidini]|nr:hypothetical protein GCM10010275_64310 [Streptomyces litmocidini]
MPAYRLPGLPKDDVRPRDVLPWVETAARNPGSSRRGRPASDIDHFPDAGGAARCGAPVRRPREALAGVPGRARARTSSGFSGRGVGGGLRYRRSPDLPLSTDNRSRCEGAAYERVRAPLRKLCHVERTRGRTWR